MKCPSATRLFRPYPATIVSAVMLLFLLAFTGCATRPGSLNTPAASMEIVPLEGGAERITGTDGSGRVLWTALRGSGSLAVAPPEISDGSILSREQKTLLSAPDTIAVINGSPHDPVRFSRGLPQEVVGYYRVGNTMYSGSDGRHDALGVPESGPPVLLPPDDQESWPSSGLGGFYSILEDDVVRETIPVRDAVSAVGWNRNSSAVVLLVVAGSDGRGLSYPEAGALLAELGATDGLALDGGGSARLTWKENGRIMSFPAAPIHRTAPNFLTLSRDAP